MNKASTTRSGLALAVAVGTVAASVLGAGSATAAPRPGRHQLADSQPRWLSRARDAGAPAGKDTIKFGLLLNLRDQAGAEATLASISDPSSKSYGNWLTNADFTARYAPAAADVASVQNWLKGQGFALRDTLGGMYVEASGTTAQVEKTFGTTVKNYEYQGQKVHANATALSLPDDTPSSVVGLVSGVLGIDQGQALRKPADPAPPQPEGFRAGQPCSAYYGQKIATDKPSAGGQKQPYAVCGYQPKQYQAAYGVDSLIKRGIDGRGVTVAVTDAYASPTIVQDVATYSRRHGLPVLGRHQFRQITPGPDGYNSADDCNGSGWYGEETLDIEAVHSMAPGANIVYVGGADCNAGLEESWAATIDKHVADIVTNSWGGSNDDITAIGTDELEFYLQFSLEAALTGITVDFSSGDAGDQTAGGTKPAAKTVDFPADVPYVTAVGGTSVGIGKNGNRVWEHGWQNAYQSLSADGKSWGDSAYTSGGGGGTSVIFQQPFYQRGVVPDSISKFFGATRMRAIPDISMPGDPNTGFLVGETQAFTNGTYYDEYRIGGTSLASPLLAGMQAVQSQKQHHAVGFANPAYYRAAGTPKLSDITAPKKPVYQVRTNYVNGYDASGGKAWILQTVDTQTSLIHSARGYDDETGVGTPGPRFFN